MSGIPDSNEVLQATQSNTNVVFKLGVVADLFTNKTAKIKFDGEETASEKQYAYMDGYIPVVGDRVVLAVISSSHIILGKISYNTAPRIKTTITDMGTLQTIEYADSTYSSNEVNMLNHLMLDTTNIYNKLKSLINALRGLGLI